MAQLAIGSDPDKEQDMSLGQHRERMARQAALGTVFGMADHGAEDMAWYSEDFARGADSDDTAVGYRSAQDEYDEARTVLGDSLVLALDPQQAATLELALRAMDSALHGHNAAGELLAEVERLRPATW